MSDSNAVPIAIFRIAKTQVDRNEVARWLDFMGVDNFQLPDESEVTNPALLIAIAAKRCYKSFTVDPNLNPNITRVRTEWGEYLDNVMKSGHGSVCEHAVYSFALENVSRVFTAEMNRHRAGWAISEGSMRYIRFSQGIKYWVPDCIAGSDVFDPSLLFVKTNEELKQLAPIADYDLKKQISRTVFSRSFAQQRDDYDVLETVWADELKPTSKFADKKGVTSMMRRIVGMGCATGGVWTGNMRALRHVITMRCEPAAEEEILHVFSSIAKMMVEDEPMLFGDFTQDEAGYWRPKYRKI